MVGLDAKEVAEILPKTSLVCVLSHHSLQHSVLTNSLKLKASKFLSNTNLLKLRLHFISSYQFSLLHYRYHKWPHSPTKKIAPLCQYENPIDSIENITVKENSIMFENLTRSQTFAPKKLLKLARKTWKKVSQRKIPALVSPVKTKGGVEWISKMNENTL